MYGKTKKHKSQSTGGTARKYSARLRGARSGFARLSDAVLIAIPRLLRALDLVPKLDVLLPILDVLPEVELLEVRLGLGDARALLLVVGHVIFCLAIGHTIPASRFEDERLSLGR